MLKSTAEHSQTMLFCWINSNCFIDGCASWYCLNDFQYFGFGSFAIFHAFFHLIELFTSFLSFSCRLLRIFFGMWNKLATFLGYLGFSFEGCQAHLQMLMILVLSCYGFLLKEIIWRIFPDFCFRFLIWMNFSFLIECLLFFQGKNLYLLKLGFGFAGLKSFAHFWIQKNFSLHFRLILHSTQAYRTHQMSSFL